MTRLAVTTTPTSTIWLVIVLAGIGTYLIRLSFIGAWGRFDTVPAIVTRALSLVPAAVMAALVLPGLFYGDGDFDIWNARLLAGVVAAIVAIRYRNVLATVAIGMTTLWILQALG
ncbi:MAG: AzlD domain-containing protein [Acidimicrobiia bacterium]|nr:AzlD domain-containing protein [Acidimicrobiia bacterium]NNK91698.1 AzlD domain-containing protein [Acidimicrobiia bacterium]